LTRLGYPTDRPPILAFLRAKQNAGRNGAIVAVCRTVMRVCGLTAKLRTGIDRLWRPRASS